MENKLQEIVKEMRDWSEADSHSPSARRLILAWAKDIEACKKSLDGNTGLMPLDLDQNKTLLQYALDLRVVQTQVKTWNVDNDYRAHGQSVLLGAVAEELISICAKFGQNPPRAGLEDTKLYWCNEFIQELTDLKSYVSITSKSENAVTKSDMIEKLLLKYKSICKGFTPPKMAGIPTVKQIHDVVFSCSDVSGSIDYDKLDTAIHDLLEKESKA